MDTTFKNADGKLPVMCIGITSGIGRLFFGYIADFPKVDRILLQQVGLALQKFLIHILIRSLILECSNLSFASDLIYKYRYPHDAPPVH